MRAISLTAIIMFLACSVLAPADATEVVVYVSKSRQVMYVYVDEGLEFIWPVSTARGGYQTPSGEYYPTALDPYHRSSLYHNAPMPYAIFFRGGYAIHGSYDIDNLGRPASHGCIRLHPEHARQLYGLVSRSDDARIIVSN
jgi:lipoprotein-anchoring transpeptidase ErfK/SrfK